MLLTVVIAQDWASSSSAEWNTLLYGSNSGRPLARLISAYAFIGSNLYMFGGIVADDSDYLSDLWVLSEGVAGASPGRPVWQQLVTTGEVPFKRWTQMVAVETRLYIMGGSCLDFAG